MLVVFRKEAQSNNNTPKKQSKIGNPVLSGYLKRLHLPLLIPRGDK